MRTNLRLGNESRLVFAAQRRAPQRHVLDEPNGHVGLGRQAGEVGVLVVVDAAHGDAVDLRMSEAGGNGGANAAPDVVDVRPARDPAKPLAVQRVETHRQSIEPGGLERGRVIVQQGAVGRHGKLGHAGHVAEHGDEPGNLVADERFAAGDLESRDAMSDRGGGD